MRAVEGRGIQGSEVGDEDFAAIRNLLVDRRRFDLGSYKDSCIRRRIARRIRAAGVERAGAYVEVLRGSEREVDALMAALTIHVSQFFRNPSMFRTLAQKILPEILSGGGKSRGRSVRLWSVGCSSGEEPYSLALLLESLAPPDLPVSVLGTDLSDKILGQAREGLYDPMRMTELPLPMKERYFTPEGNAFRLHSRIRSRVQFQRHDILDDGRYPAADLILCRNVLIYFSRTEQESILCRLAEALPENGWLVLGKAETLVGESRRFFKSEYPADRIYRRG